MTNGVVSVFRNGRVIADNAVTTIARNEVKILLLVTNGNFIQLGVNNFSCVDAFNFQYYWLARQLHSLGLVVCDVVLRAAVVLDHTNVDLVRHSLDNDGLEDSLAVNINVAQ